MLPSVKYKAACNFLSSASTLAIAAHCQPDGDAWGAMAALGCLADWHGYRAVMCGSADDLGLFSFLPLPDLTDNQAVILKDCSAIVTVDCANRRRSYLSDWLNAKPATQRWLDIDHHPNLKPEADLVLRDTSAAATCEVLYDYCVANGLPISSKLATCLLTGIITDTGHLLYPAARAKVFATAADLLQKGGRLDLICQASWRCQTIVALKIWGVALSRLMIEGDLALSYLLPDDLAVAGSLDPLDDLAGFLSGLAGVKAILLLKDRGLGEVKGSWRAVNSDYSVLPLAQRWGGGGHPMAAGFSLPGKILPFHDGIGLWESGSNKIRQITDLLPAD